MKPLQNTKTLKTNKRCSMIEQGVYDGRYKTKVVKEKKKTQYLKFRKNKKSQLTCDFSIMKPFATVE